MTERESLWQFRVIWLGSPWRFGRWPNSYGYWLFDLGPLRMGWGL